MHIYIYIQFYVHLPAGETLPLSVSATLAEAPGEGARATPGLQL